MMHLLAIGLGYAARHVASALAEGGWSITGTTRAAEPDVRAPATAMIRFDPANGIVPETLPADTTHLLVSAAPDANGDPVITHLDDQLVMLLDLEWVGYFSTIGVYGDRDGGWVDEAASRDATSERAQRRIAAEDAWLAFGARTGVATQIFRLPGIYGKGRSPFTRIREGKARRIIKPGQVFNRAHVEDIAAVVRASIAAPRAGAVYNVSDDEPAPPQDVIAYAAELIGVDAPPEVSFDDADMSDMARAFYADCKRVKNDRIKRELGVSLRYPTYREGLAAVLAAERAEAS
ncbi:MAG: SDR family oxidoreductase [Pseudomonadota bacterium]